MMMMMNELPVCRCCLREHANHQAMHNLYENAGRLCGELLECVPNLQINPEDGLTPLICEQCFTRIQEILAFRHCCAQSEQELRRRRRCLTAVSGYAEMPAITKITELPAFYDSRVESVDANEQQVPQNADMGPELPVMEDSGIECGPLELSMLDDLLPQEYNFERILDYNGSVRTPNDDEDSVISVELNEPTFIQGGIGPTESSPFPSEESLTPIAAPPPPLKTLHRCPHCEKKFTRNFQLKLHMISVHKLGDGRQYKCVECEKTFASRHSLSYHQKSVHSEERPFACPHCDRRFVLRTQLASHLRVHTGQPKPRILECMECGKRWPTKSDLRTHMRSHVPAVERPFQCDQCEKSFFTRGHLNSHLLVHTGEKPFACALCEKSYQSVGNLNNHMVRHHAGVAVCGRGRGTALEMGDREL